MNQIKIQTKEMNLGQIILYLSPLFIVAFGNLNTFLLKPMFGVWLWVPVLLLYWVVLGIFLFVYGGKGNWKQLLKKPDGKWFWSVLPFVAVPMTLPMFFGNLDKLWSAEIFIPWLLIGLINPVLEEGYWRGLLQDRRGRLPVWLVIGYSSIMFSMNHLAFGASSATMRNPVFLANTLVLGLIYSVVYYKTKSLKWLIIAHSLMDLLGLSVLCFMDLFIPPSFG